MKTEKEALNDIRSIVSKWLVDGEVESSESIGQIAAVLIQPIAADPAADHIQQILDGIADAKAVNINQREQAEAWVAVFKTIAECIPGAFDADGRAVDQACAAIRQLVAEAGRKAEARIDVIGQNGNTGEHYEELAELAIQQGGRPIEDEQAPAEPRGDTPY